MAGSPVLEGEGPEIILAEERLFFCVGDGCSSKTRRRYGTGGVREVTPMAAAVEHFLPEGTALGEGGVPLAVPPGVFPLRTLSAMLEGPVEPELAPVGRAAGAEADSSRGRSPALTRPGSPTRGSSPLVGSRRGFFGGVGVECSLRKVREAVCNL